MRRYSRLLMMPLLLMSFSLFAAPPPPGLEPLPEPPPLPDGADSDPLIEPQVTITKKGEDTVEEYRINGQLYMQKITPPHGVPYYLVRESIDGGWARQDGPGDQIAVPQWILFHF